jgi:hypothetical protein
MRPEARDAAYLLAMLVASSIHVPRLVDQLAPLIPPLPPESEQQLP